MNQGEQSLHPSLKNKSELSSLQDAQVRLVEESVYGIDIFFISVCVVDTEEKS